MTPRVQTKTTEPAYKVTLIRDTALVFPELWCEVFIEEDDSEGQQRAFAEMFVRGRCTKAVSPAASDLVVFTGGSDVNPAYYGEEPHKTTHFNTARDEANIKLYNFCLQEGIPMFGVCRGAQFLHVMNGGKLFQDVDNHVGDHSIFDVRTKTHIPKVSSVHHQACIADPALGMEVLATSAVANSRWKNPTVEVKGTMADVEAFFYRDTCCLGVQGHPEYRGYHQFLQWTLEQISELIVLNPDLELKGKVRRIKDDVLAQRDAKWATKRQGAN